MPMVELRARNDPDRIGRFSIIGRLGSGGFGTVYVAAERDRADELVAVKVMQPSVARDRAFRARFEKEIDAVHKVTSDYVPKLIDHGRDGDELWLATQLVRGPSLQDVVDLSGPLPEPTVRLLGLCIAVALRDIHGAGLAHRDLKPGNVLLVRDGPRIIDFGLAHLTDAGHQTASGMPMCSPGYAPPEQREHLWNAGPPADIFSFGGTLLFAAAGHSPYDPLHVPSSSPPDLRDLPDSLYDIVAECLRTEPGIRPGVKKLAESFERATGSSASAAHLAFPSALTDKMLNAIDAWQRNLDHVLRLGAAGPGASGSWAAAPDGAAPAPPHGMRSTAVLTDARVQTNIFDKDRGTPTIPMPAPRAAPAAEGQGVRHEWTKSLPDWIRGPATATNDMAVVASLGGLVAGFAARNGNDVGKVSLGVPVRSPVLPPGTLGTGLAYASGTDGGVYAIDLRAGQHWPLLRADTGIVGSPIAAGNHLYALTADGCVWEIEPLGGRDPEPVCQLRVPAVGALTVADGLLVAATADGNVYVIPPNTGKSRWLLRTGGLVFGAPAVAAGWLYIAGTDGRLWSARLHGTERVVLDIGVPVHAAPVHHRGRLYVGGSDGKVRVLDVSGEAAGAPTELWTIPGLGGEVSGIAAHGETVVATAGRSLTVLDGTGRQRVAWSQAALISGAPAMTDDFIYVTSLNGAVTCLSLDKT